ncbi:EF-hand domain-containing protein [Pseudaquabacterium terrae]|uniref:EF-hand domain-containing protein n=1 Tax=Pseudaquabacterium terrae TaxID=2732868 RepID=UPI001564BF1A
MAAALFAVFAGLCATAVAARTAAPAEFAAMDADRDGRLTPAEHAAAAAKMFAAMDANHDQRITAAEMQAATKRLTGRAPRAKDLSAAEKIKVIDTDGDGVLSAAEHAGGSRSMFVAMDTDKDGYLSRGEFVAGHAQMLKKG